MSDIMPRHGLNRLKMHPHVLKHTHAMHSVKAGIGIESIRETLGHKSLASTGFYTRIPQDDAVRAFAKAMGGSA
jgi:integrase/recombinase XerC